MDNPMFVPALADGEMAEVQAVFGPLAAPVVMFSMPGCPHCDDARGYLTEAGIPFAEIKVEDREERMRLYAAWSADQDGDDVQPEPNSMPQVWVEGVRIGGAADIRANRLAEHWPALVA